MLSDKNCDIYFTASVLNFLVVNTDRMIKLF